MSRDQGCDRGRGVRVVAVAVGLLVTACTGATAPDGGSTAPPAPPPRPPAACLLDVPALDAATGLRWRADATTASDGRCVYDTDPPGAAFLAVELTRPAAPAAERDALVPLCTGASTPAGDGGFVCGLTGGGLLAARPAGAALVTITASAVPTGTTGDALTRALAEQLPRLPPPP